MVRRVIEYGAIVFSGAYGSSASNDWQRIALLDEPATLQPDSCPCANLDHGHCSASYSEQRQGAQYPYVVRRKAIADIVGICSLLRGTLSRAAVDGAYCRR